ncbi:hypothetical protein OC835_003816 [Tilletia horrida]|nr:hypothetical protein OC835_003816 [Tilletia horrida]
MATSSAPSSTSSGWTIEDLYRVSVDPNLTPDQARQVQQAVARQVHIPSNAGDDDDRLPACWPWSSTPSPGGQKDHLLIAAMDISYPIDTTLDTAACLVLVRLDWPIPSNPNHTANVTKLHTIIQRHPPPRFPYIPGLLAFRELPPILALLDELRSSQCWPAPDLLLCDGQGIAHPARCGIAAHLGVLTGLPSVGSAKSWFVGRPEEGGRCGDGDSDGDGDEGGAADEPSAAPAETGSKLPRPAFKKGSNLGTERSARLPLFLPTSTSPDPPSQPRSRPEPAAYALRTQDGLNPIFVSPGHRLSTAQAADLVLALCTRYRLPDPIRWADQASREALRVWARERERIGNGEQIA